MPRATRTSQKADEELAVGVDIGTTFSSVNVGKTSPLLRGDFDIKIVRDWEWWHKAADSEAMRVPTQIVYDENREVRWGYNIPDDFVPLRYFKLLLYDEQGLPDHLKEFPHLDEMRERIKQLGKTPVTVLADYLRELWKHSLNRFDEEFGANNVKALAFRVVFTVPAIWSEKTKESMRSAIQQAGILDKRLAGQTSLRFISEPEAAAISMLHTLPAHHPSLKRGVKLLVCDCGGGTVDLTPYEITHIKFPKTGRRELNIKECAPGSGGLFGAIFLDQAFLKYFIDVIGPHNWDNIRPDLKKLIMDESWESSIKRGFTEKSTRSWPVRMYDKEPVTLNKHGLSSVFRDSVVSHILQLVRDQVELISDNTSKDGGQDLKFVMLAGGFGQCAFIYEALKDELGDSITTIRLPGDEPRNAISRGAVLDAILRKCHSAPVEERKSRYSYVALYDEPWDDKEWEKKIKRDFSTTTTAPCIMHMPNGCITLRKKEVSQVFKKAMRPILCMVFDQVNSMAADGDMIIDEDMPKFIILVGGYGRCSFLYDYLQEELGEEELYKDINILQSRGSKPWSAICRGAVLSVIKRKSLVGPVLQRKARQSYGWTMEEGWDPRKHNEGVDEKKFDDVRGKYMAVNQFHWDIKTGDDINSNVKSNPYHFAFPLGKKGHYKYHADIYKTHSPSLPSRLLPEDQNVQRVGGLDLDFPVRIEDLPTRNNEQGEVIQVLDYVTKSTVNGDSFDIWAEYNGNDAGKLELEIDVSEHTSQDDD